MNVHHHIRMPTKLLRAAASAMSLAVIALIALAPAASARPALIFASNERDCLANRNVNTFLRHQPRERLRLILSPQDAQADAGIGCISDAHAAGFKVYISLQFNNRWTPGPGRLVLQTGSSALRAVSLGRGGRKRAGSHLTNRLRPGHESLTGHGRTAGQRYRAIWDAVEPILVRLVPHAIRVYGEFSPWSFAATKQGFASGRPPGVQAIAAHCYHTESRRPHTSSTERGLGRIQTTATLVLGNGTGASETPHPVLGPARHLGLLERDRQPRSHRRAPISG